MKKIITVVGARPQFVKAAILSQLFEKCNDINEIIVHTGQHFEQNMSQSFFDELKIPNVKYQLDVNNKSHAVMTADIMKGLEPIYLSEKPDAVLIYGDTNSTLAAALTAKKMSVPIIHIEAGLRMRDFTIPEEINRAITDRISNLLLCPSEDSVHNLQLEGFENFENV